MEKYVLVLNCGSSSLKFAVIDVIEQEKILFGTAECLNSKESRIIYQRYRDQKKETILIKNLTHKRSINFIVQTILLKNLENLNSIVGIGHRIVHGGKELNRSVIINNKILKKIQESVPFAPLHNPFGIIGFKEASYAFPNLKNKQVAVFDTTFHNSIPRESHLYAIPYYLYKKYGIRRYGAHGISHQYVSEKFAKIVKKDIKKLNIISCHLGNGGSITAIVHGKSVDTSMGMTPLEGLMMGTRSGDIDPSIIFYLYNVLKMNVSQIQDILTKKSGILGITQVSNDMRFVENHYNKNVHANCAMKMYCYRLSKYIASYFITMNKFPDGIVFTGGIGENSVMVRKITMDKLKIFNVKCDEKINSRTKFGKCAMISKSDSIPVWVIPTNEELIIAKETFDLLKEKS
ncbi:acetate kinase [Candidatus Riesia pediculicola]|nr:acetate kinase [Candidatus Riesia pediculicola]